MYFESGKYLKQNTVFLVYRHSKIVLQDLAFEIWTEAEGKPCI